MTIFNQLILLPSNVNLYIRNTIMVFLLLLSTNIHANWVNTPAVYNARPNSPQLVKLVADVHDKTFTQGHTNQFDSGGQNLANNPQIDTLWQVVTVSCKNGTIDYSGNFSPDQLDPKSTTIQIRKGLNINSPVIQSTLLETISTAVTDSKPDAILTSTNHINASSQSNKIFFSNSVTGIAPGIYSLTVKTSSPFSGFDKTSITTNSIDFGDAPESFATTLSSSGPGHCLSSSNKLKLGVLIKGENDGQPSTTALADGLEEDGIIFPFLRPESKNYTVLVSLSNQTAAVATLCGWFDFNLNNRFDDNTSEKSCTKVPQGARNVDLNFKISDFKLDSIDTYYYSRFRICSIAQECSSATGIASNGEVEDYLVPFGTLPVTISSFDSTRNSNRLTINWSTVSEFFNSGFQLWGMDKPSAQWVPLNKWLIPSGSGNRAEPQSYRKHLKVPNLITDLSAVGISSVDADGSEHFYGPFEVDKQYGELTSLDPINWASVRTKTNALMKKNSYLPTHNHSYSRLTTKRHAADNLTAQVAQFSVQSNGLYKINAQQLLSLGLDWRATPTSEIALIDHDGKPISRHIVTQDTDTGQAKTLGDSGYIVFYGHGVDETAQLYSSHSVYRLLRDETKVRLAQQQSEQGVTDLPSSSYREQSWVENQNQYLTNSALADPWLSHVILSYSDRARGAQYRVPIEADAMLDKDIELLIHAGRSSALPVIDANQDGVQDPEHILRPVLLSSSGFKILEPQTATGSGAWDTSQTLPQKIQLPNDGEMRVGAVFTAGTGYEFSEVYIDAVGLTYSRPYIAKPTKNYLTFTAPNQGETNFQVQLPIASGASIYASDGSELINIKPESIQKNRSIGGEDVKLVRFATWQNVNNSAQNPEIHYWVNNDQGYLNVDNLSLESIHNQSQLVDAASDYNYLIIAHPAFIGRDLYNFATHKRSMGHNVYLLDYLELVNHFGGGQVGPKGLTKFLSSVEAASNGALSNVLLVGGSSYDHRNYLGSDSVTFIPSHYGQSIMSRHAPNDNLYVQNHDGSLFAAIGRWPVRTPADLKSLINKTIQWDTQQVERPTALLIAEKNLHKEGIDFSLSIEGLSYHLPTDYRQIKVYINDDLSASEAKKRIKAALKNTPQVVIYNGHGSSSRLGKKNLYQASDVTDNQAGGSSLWLPMSCYMTYFEGISVNSLAHQLLFLGPSVAISGASLLSNQTDSLNFTTSMLDSLNDGNSLGASISKSITNTINPSLLGDPSIQLHHVGSL